MSDKLHELKAHRFRRSIRVWGNYVITTDFDIIIVPLIKHYCVWILARSRTAHFTSTFYHHLYLLRIKEKKMRLSLCVTTVIFPATQKFTHFNRECVINAAIKRADKHSQRKTLSLQTKLLISCL